MCFLHTKLKSYTDSLSSELDRGAGGLLSEVIRRLCVVRSEGDLQPAACTKLYMRKGIGISGGLFGFRSTD